MGRAAAVAMVAAVATPFAVGFAMSSTLPDEGRAVFAFTDPAIVESSGLVADGEFAHTVNDSGDDGRVFTVDPATGDTVGVTSWSRSVDDVEAIAPGSPGHVWVGDIGDNDALRDGVFVAEVPVGEGDQQVDPTFYELRYPSGARNAETLMTVPGTGQLVIVTKGVFGGEVYTAPERLQAGRPNRLTQVGVALGIATDGAFFPDGRHLIVRNYAQAIVYTWPELDEVGTVDLPDQRQGEGIAVTPGGRVWISTEGARSDVTQVRLPRAIRRALEPPTATPSPDAPSTEPDVGEQPGPADPPDAPPLWPWAVGGLVGSVVLVTLLRRRRPRKG